MPTSELKKRVRLHQFLLSIIAIFVILHFGRSILIPLSFGAILAFALYPIVARFERMGAGRTGAIIATLALVIVIVLCFSLLIGQQFILLIQDLPGLVAKLQDYLFQLQEWIAQKINIGETQQLDFIRDNINQFVKTGTQILTTTLSTTTNILFYVGIVPVYVYLMLYYRNIFKNFVFDLTQRNNRELANEIMGETRLLIQSYITGIFLVILIIAILYSIGLVIIGVKYALFFGVVTALLCIIPYFGVFIGAFITIIYTFATGDAAWQPFAVAGLYAVVQMLEGNLITPLVVGGQVRLNALVVIIAVFLGGFVWGGAGLILAVPLVGIAKMFFDNIDSLKPYGRVLGMPKPSKIKRRRKK